MSSGALHGAHAGNDGLAKARQAAQASGAPTSRLPAELSESRQPRSRRPLANRSAALSRKEVQTAPDALDAEEHPDLLALADDVGEWMADLFG
jgi:hypothetical protein